MSPPSPVDKCLAPPCVGRCKLVPEHLPAVVHREVGALPGRSHDWDFQLGSDVFKVLLFHLLSDGYIQAKFNLAIFQGDRLAYTDDGYRT